MTLIHVPRPPERIDQVLDRLEKIWKEHPDYRLGQLVVNALRPKSPCPEIFYAEDDVLLNGLSELEKLLNDPQ